MTPDVPTRTTSDRLPYRVRRRQQADRSSRRGDSLKAQFKRHSVALISLVVAIVSLGYNTWRNETSEIHRNWRQAAFNVTIEINQIQRIVLYRRYFHDREQHPLTPLRDAETWVAGWSTVAGIRDLTSLLPEPLPERGRHLMQTWEEHAGDLDAETKAAKRAEQALLESIDRTRKATLNLINRLS